MANNDRRDATRFIVYLGVVSLFADVTYEGARSVIGPYLQVLGASAAVVGIVAGAGELIGYGLRLASGYLADRSRAYWPLTMIGYVINLGAVPLMALTAHWQPAALLVLTERAGKAIRTPSRDAMLSHAARLVGRGWAFGLHEAMDQAGALTGPLIIALVLARSHNNYRLGMAILAVPAILSLASLVLAQRRYPNPRDFEDHTPGLAASGFPRVFWLYLAAAGLVGAGYSDFPLIAYHLKRVDLLSDTWIPVLYSVAMGVSALAALAFGRLFDRFGIPILMLSAVMSAFAAPLVYLGDFRLVLIGMALWGLGMGAQQSILRAAVGSMVPADRRGSAYGVFNTGFGVMWFAGSAIMGVLYGRSPRELVIFSVVMQLLSLPIFAIVNRGERTSAP